jgi:hypothetical protein
LLFVGLVEFAVKCVHLDHSVLQRPLQMNSVTLEELESGPTQVFSKTQSKEQKLKRKLKKEIFVKTYAQKKLWNNSMTTKVKQSKKEN